MALNIHPDGVDVTSGHVEADAYLSVSLKVMAQFPHCKKGNHHPAGIGQCQPQFMEWCPL